jgi:hypothetical protein
VVGFGNLSSLSSKVLTDGPFVIPTPLSNVLTTYGTTWNKLGADIDGEATDDQSGISVSMSADGTIVAIGATLNDGTSGNVDIGVNCGHVRVYKYTPSKTVDVTVQTDASFGPIGWTRIGADIIGEFATRNALALGASVKVFDNNVSRLQRLQNNLGQRVWTSVLEPKILAKQLKTCEVAVGALRNDFSRAPIVVTEDMVAAMRPGSIIIDVAIDRGGCFETSELTNHENPIRIKHGVIHYGVPNIPSGFARTASQAISNVLMPLLVQIGDLGGLSEIIWHQIHLREGIYLYKGALTDFYISEKFNLKYTDLNLLIASKS